MADWEREKELWRAGYYLVAGCDEVGRGPLAGPVVAAVVAFTGPLALELHDSKALSPQRRQQLSKVIWRQAAAVGLGVVDNRTIDRINILNATKLAMGRAWDNLGPPKPDYLLVDALAPESLAAKVKLEAIIKGDSRQASIAAASIIAKVYRDGLMACYHATYPHYNFSQNKGYPTREHYQALRDYGCCPLHRRTFRGVVNE